MKIMKSVRSENHSHSLTKSKASSLPVGLKPAPQQQSVPCPPMRRQCVGWLYRAQANLHFSRSTLFLAFSLLDRLLQRGLALTEDTCELVAGALLLVCTKFNEVYPVTVRKLNLLAEGEFTLQQFLEAEGAMLQALDFTVLLDPTYEQLCALESRFGGKTGDSVREQIKLAILNPNETFRYGPTSLVMAVQESASQN